MLLTHGLKVLLLRWKILCIAILSALAIAVAIILTSVPIYKSVASVVIDVRAPETIGPQQASGQMSPEYIMTQEGILRSSRVAQEVVNAEGLAKIPGFAEQLGWTAEKGPVVEYLAGALLRQMVVEPSIANARIIEIGYLSSDPNFSAEMANNFAKAFINVSIALQAQPARRAMMSYDVQMKETAERLKTAQEQLAERERQLGVISSKDESSADTVGLTALSNSRAQAAAASSRAASEASMGSLPQLATDPSVQALKAKIGDLVAQRQQMSQVAGPNNSQIRQLNSQIGALNAELGEQEGRVRRAYQTAAAQSAAAAGRIEAQVTSQKQRVTTSQEAMRKLSQLQLDVASAQQAYDQMATRRTQLKVLSDTGQTNILNLTAAEPNLEPVSPRKLVILCIGLLGGLTVGMVIAFGIELFDLRLRTANELEAWLGIPNLATIRPIAEQRNFLAGPIAGLLPHRRS